MKQKACLRPSALLAALLPLLLLWIGCEEEVTAVLGTEKPFSLYAVLSPQLDTQEVVLYPITERLAPLKPDSLAAEVTMTDRSSGATYTLSDSAFQEPDGRWAHLFYWPEAARYGHTYHIRAKNPGGAVTRAEVTVPPRVTIDIGEPLTLGRVRIPVAVQGEAPRLMHIEVEYHVKHRRGPPDRTIDTLFIDYDERQKKTAEGWQITINLSEDYQKMARWCGWNGCWALTRGRWGLRLMGMRLHLAVVSEAWDPPGSEHAPGVREAPGPGPSFDREVLVQPGTMSNVENGFGFVGAGYRTNTPRWVPSDEVLEEAGFRTQ